MDRQHRNELKHDKFVDEIGSLSTKARENQRFLVMVTAVIVVVVLIGYGIYFYRSNREQQAQDALAAAIDTIDSPLVVANQPQQNPLAKFKTEAERSAAAETMFKDVQSKFAGSDAADVANLYLARIDSGRGDVATARKLLDSFVHEHPKNVLVGAAKYSLYQLRIEAGEGPQVITELNAELSQSTPQLPSDTILALLAKAYQAQGQPDKSKETYRRIITEFPDSPYALEAQRAVGPAA